MLVIFCILDFAFSSLSVDVELLKFFLLYYCTFGSQHVLESVGEKCLFPIFDLQHLPIFSIERFPNSFVFLAFLKCLW